MSALAVLVLFSWAALARKLAPNSNTSLTRFDAIIVLGTPSDEDGNPARFNLPGSTEAVREYERGVAPRLILTGGAVKNAHVEATVMARIAEAQGFPASAIFVEGKARDTIQNACYSVRIMESQGWHSAEVVPTQAICLGRGLSSASRRWSGAPMLPAAGACLDAAPDREAALETLKTLRYLVWARWRERCEP